MGWFLTKPSKKKKKGRGRKKKAEGWDPRRTLAGLKVLGVIAALVAVAVAWRAGEVALVGYAKEHRAAPITPADVTLLDRPEWVAGRLEQQLREAVAQRIGSDPFDGQGLTDAVAVLMDDPWVAEVRQVRRTPSGVTVDATYRQPLAMVKVKDGFHLIDTQGVRLLGPASYEALEPMGLPLITGVTVAPPQRPGMPWTSSEIEAGIELVKLLQDEPFAGQIVEYDVGQRDHRTDKLCLVLHTDGGMVVWGRPPSDAWAVAEVSTAEKIDRLHKLADTYLGRIDAGGRIVWVHGEQIQTDDRPLQARGPAIEPTYRQGYTSRR